MYHLGLSLNFCFQFLAIFTLPFHSFMPGKLASHSNKERQSALAFPREENQFCGQQMLEGRKARMRSLPLIHPVSRLFPRPQIFASISNSVGWLESSFPSQFLSPPAGFFPFISNFHSLNCASSSSSPSFSPFSPARPSSNPNENISKGKGRNIDRLFGHNKVRIIHYIFANIQFARCTNFSPNI